MKTKTLSIAGLTDGDIDLLQECSHESKTPVIIDRETQTLTVAAEDADAVQGTIDDLRC